MTTTRRLTALSIAAGLLSLILMQLHLARFERRVSGGPPVEIVGLTRDVSAGAALDASMLDRRRLPERHVESHHIPAARIDELVGTRLTRDRRGDESLLWSDLTGLTAGDLRLSERVPHGMRAMAISAAGELSALIQPGDRVDVLCTPSAGAAPNPGGRVRTRTVLENLIVLARGDDLGAAGTTARRSARGALTVGVRVDDSRRLADARDCGRLHVTLRHPDDLLLSKAAPAPRPGGSDAR